jgi:hypothetical protein
MSLLDKSPHPTNAGSRSSDRKRLGKPKNNLSTGKLSLTGLHVSRGRALDSIELLQRINCTSTAHEM